MKYTYFKFVFGGTVYMTGLTFYLYKSINDHYKNKTIELNYLNDKLHNKVKTTLIYTITLNNFLD